MLQADSPQIIWRLYRRRLLERFEDTTNADQQMMTPGIAIIKQAPTQSPNILISFTRHV